MRSRKGDSHNTEKVFKTMSAMKMNEKQIIKSAMKARGINQEQLAHEVGYKTQSSISSRLSGYSMRVDTFVKLLSAMGYAVVVKSAVSNDDGEEWTVSQDEGDGENG